MSAVAAPPEKLGNRTQHFVIYKQSCYHVILDFSIEVGITKVCKVQRKRLKINAAPKIPAIEADRQLPS